MFAVPDLIVPRPPGPSEPPAAHTWPTGPYGHDAWGGYVEPVADFLIVITTVDDQDAARKLSRSAVEARLAASWQVTGPIETTYRHLGEVSEGTEYQVTFRTTGDRREALEKHLVDNTLRLAGGHRVHDRRRPCRVPGPDHPSHPPALRALQ
ncbi:MULTISPECIES: divalent-cation tolerance protein CutA [Streptomyces]|uniref:divalent-cation tolerance protein CutA n=1 Tax=Streptomyces TaxID=1883 RepID=UPI0034E55447